MNHSGRFTVYMLGNMIQASSGVPATRQSMFDRMRQSNRSRRITPREEHGCFPLLASSMPDSDGRFAVDSVLSHHLMLSHQHLLHAKSLLPSGGRKTLCFLKLGVPAGLSKTCYLYLHCFNAIPSLGAKQCQVLRARSFGSPSGGSRGVCTVILACDCPWSTEQYVQPPNTHSCYHAPL